MTWYARTGPRSKITSGKFRSYTKLGTDKTEGESYRGWHYNFVGHQTSGSVSRTRYAVAISDANGHRVEYLRDFFSIKQATEAAREYIDNALDSVLRVAAAGEVGTIPALPNVPITQET